MANPTPLYKMEQGGNVAHFTVPSDPDQMMASVDAVVTALRRERKGLSSVSVDLGNIPEPNKQACAEFLVGILGEEGFSIVGYRNYLPDADPSPEIRPGPSYNRHAK
ncbi:hypothetical protein GOV09_05010 [Candidatus Woesearchaeota archaeon]|nr:hypothetical protein [Candidatus Woesearchaeota archaeon]